jgi:hydrogenase nickel incorporation protein HypA/HybF
LAGLAIISAQGEVGIMHEYGIVRSVLSLVDENVRANDGRRAVRVLLSVSGLAAGEERLLREAFDTFKAGTLAGDADLVLEDAPVEVWCPDCGARARLAGGQDRRCPQCGSGAVLIAPGDIVLKSVEIEV